MQRRFEYDDIQNSSFICDKDVNILIMNAFVRHHMQEFNGRFFGVYYYLLLFLLLLAKRLLFQPVVKV